MSAGGVTPEDISEIRKFSRAVREYDVRVEEFTEYFATLTGDDIVMLSIRCDLSNHKKRHNRPEIAKISVTPAGVLFESKIRARPADREIMTPSEFRWLRSQLGELADDDIRRWTRAINQRVIGQEPGEPGILPPFPDDYYVIHDVIDMPGDGPERPDLWTRCKEHQDQSGLYTRADIMQYARDGVSNRRRHPNAVWSR